MFDIGSLDLLTDQQKERDLQSSSMPIDDVSINITVKGVVALNVRKIF